MNRKNKDLFLTYIIDELKQNTLLNGLEIFRLN